jgi:hypothetical protein
MANAFARAIPARAGDVCVAVPAPALVGDPTPNADFPVIDPVLFNSPPP